MGSRKGQRASKSACFVVPPLFRADSGTNLIKQGKISKVSHWLNNSVVSRIARGPGFESRSGHDFFLPCDMWPCGSVAQLAECSHGKREAQAMWLGSSVGRALAR